MTKSLIKFANYLGPKEAGHSAVFAGNVLPVDGVEFDVKVKDRPKTIQPEVKQYA